MRSVPERTTEIEQRIIMTMRYSPIWLMLSEERGSLSEMVIINTARLNRIVTPSRQVKPYTSLPAKEYQLVMIRY